MCDNKFHFNKFFITNCTLATKVLQKKKIQKTQKTVFLIENNWFSNCFCSSNDFNHKISSYKISDVSIFMVLCKANGYDDFTTLHFELLKSFGGAYCMSNNVFGDDFLTFSTI